jgi:hypothetical protein
MSVAGNVGHVGHESHETVGQNAPEIARLETLFVANVDLDQYRRIVGGGNIANKSRIESLVQKRDTAAIVAIAKSLGLTLIPFASLSNEWIDAPPLPKSSTSKAAWANNVLDFICEKASVMLHLDAREQGAIRADHVNDDNEINIALLEMRYPKLYGSDSVDVWKNILGVVSRSELVESSQHQHSTAPAAIAKRAFSLPYKDCLNLVDRFEAFVERQMETWWSDPAIYAPYFTIVQSSGTGKSRLIQHYAESSKAIVLYICLRQEHCTGFPLTSIIASRLLQPRGNSADYIAAFLTACFESISEDFTPPADMFTGPSRDFWRAIEERADKILAESSGSLRTMNAAFRDMFTRTRDRQIVFVFDEARFLLSDSRYEIDGISLFGTLRRCLASLETTSTPRRFMTILVDAISKISTSSPADRVDSSSRDDRRQLKLLPPFYQLTTWNLGIAADRPSFGNFVDTEPQETFEGDLQLCT